MSFLMHIAFDNTKRLTRNVHYFEYLGVRFKLIQNNPRKWSDVLLTIVPHPNSVEAQKAYSAAGEFLSALSWEITSSVALRYIGGAGLQEGSSIRQARCRAYSFPEVPFQGLVSGYGISPIAEIISQDQRIGLTLFREAKSSNKVLLSFLLYWQIMEIRTGDPVGWINKVHRRHPRGLHIRSDDIAQLPLNGRSLGEYLLHDCRHAIAHIRRKPGRVPLKFDTGEENHRLARSTRVIEALAKYYIESELKVIGRLYLVRVGGRGFPRYVNDAFLRSTYCTPVRYRTRPWNKFAPVV